MQSESTEVKARRGEYMAMDVSATGLTDNATQPARTMIQV